MHLVGYLYEDYHDAQSLEHSGNFLPTFRDNVSVPSSGVKNPS
jgi:hypothetical protein